MWEGGEGGECEGVWSLEAPSQQAVNDLGMRLNLL